MFGIGMAIVMILSVILPLSIVIMIIVAIVKAIQGNKQEDSDIKFLHAIRAFYVYLILICFLLGVIGSTVYLFDSVVKLVLPDKETPVSSYYDYYNTEDYVLDEDASSSIPTSQLEINNYQKNQSIVDMITAAGFLGVCLPIFICYTRIAKKDAEIKKEQKETSK